MENMQFFLVRLLASVLATALASAGVVWIVVQMAISGVEGNISTTNKRIDDLRTDLSKAEERLLKRIDERALYLEKQLRAEFETTRRLMRRTDLQDKNELKVPISSEPTYARLILTNETFLVRATPSIIGFKQILVDPNYTSLAKVLMTQSNSKDGDLVFVPLLNNENWAVLESKKFQVSKLIVSTKDRLPTGLIRDAYAPCFSTDKKYHWTDIVSNAKGPITLATSAILLKNEPSPLISATVGCPIDINALISGTKN